MRLRRGLVGEARARSHREARWKIGGAAVGGIANAPPGSDRGLSRAGFDGEDPESAAARHQQFVNAPCVVQVKGVILGAGW